MKVRRALPGVPGSRLNEFARHVRVQGQTIDHFASLAASDALGAWANLSFRGNQKTIAADLLPEIEQRLNFMGNVGLGLSLARTVLRKR